MNAPSSAPVNSHTHPGTGDFCLGATRRAPLARLGVLRLLLERVLSERRGAAAGRRGFLAKSRVMGGDARPYGRYKVGCKQNGHTDDRGDCTRHGRADQLGKRGAPIVKDETRAIPASARPWFSAPTMFQAISSGSTSIDQRVRRLSGCCSSSAISGVNSWCKRARLLAWICS